MADIKGWIEGVADEAAGLAKRALGEFTARPDLVLDGEHQQAQGRQEVVAASGAGGGRAPQAIGWKLEPQERAALLGRFPPRYAQVIADHVTLAVSIAADPPRPCSAVIVGRADDGLGLEALIVEIDGTTQRPDGGTFHLTWSHEPGRQPHESNDVIARAGWTPFRARESISLDPARC